MVEYVPVYIYFAVVLLITLLMLGSSLLYPSRKMEPLKYMPYESGIQTETHLLQERFPLRHYLGGADFSCVRYRSDFSLSLGSDRQKLARLPFMRWLFSWWRFWWDLLMFGAKEDCNGNEAKGTELLFWWLL